MDNAAYTHLSANARAIYTEIKRRYNGSNNGFIVYSVRQAADELNIGRSTSARAFRELEAHGFIVAEQRGAFHWKIDVTGERHRPASEWRLTVYHSDRVSGVESRYPTKDFMRWEKIQNTVPLQSRMGPVVKPYGTRGGTMKNKNSPNGTCSGTMKAVS
jgi:DNA-binding transcriptional MocR family regulator